MILMSMKIGFLILAKISSGVSANLLYGFGHIIVQSYDLPLSLFATTSWRRVDLPKRASASFTYLGSYADSRSACQLISWQLPCGIQNMKPSSGDT